MISKKKKTLISVIVPCFNETENIKLLYERVTEVFKNLSNFTFEIIYVDNASTDSSEKIINKLAIKDNKVKAIFMSRNFGSPQPSFIAGLEYSRGEAAVFLHGDIQDPPELIPQFIQKWLSGYDVIYGVRTSREGYNLVWNFFYKVFYLILNKLAYIEIPLNSGEVSLMSKRAYTELLKLEENDYYLRCLRAFVGFKQVGVPYVRSARLHGKSTENFFTGLWWAKTILVNFSFKPLEWISLLAFSVMLLTFLLIVINLIWIIIYHDSPRGVPTIVILVLFLGGIQLLSLSVIAEYLARIFLEVKKRPRYIIRKIINLPKGV